jgi:ADP-heptose:LPS heptosyltransferase
MVNSIPALRALKTSFPKAQLTLISTKWNTAVIEGCPYIDEMLIYHTNDSWFNKVKREKFAFFKQLALFIKLRKAKYDLAIDPAGWPNSNKLLYMSGAKVKLLNNFERWDFYYNALINHKTDNVHESKRALDLLRLIGIKNDDYSTELWLSLKEKSEAREFLYNAGLNENQIIGIHPGAPWPPRRWPIEMFAQLADKIWAAYRLPMLFFVGKNEENLLEGFSSIVKEAHIVPVLGKRLRSVMALIDKCTVFVCNDTGPMHIAVALKVPTVAIFGPGVVENWAPPSPPHIVIRNPNINCSPCSQISCQDNICLKSIPVDQVWKGVKKLLERKYIHNK